MPTVAAQPRRRADTAAQPTAPPIRRIDHIMIGADDPGKVYGFGNVNVEAIRFPGQKSQASRAQLLGTLWTNVTLPQFSDGEAADATTHVFLSEYSPKYVNVEERRERLRTQLTESGGGPLGVEAVKEVIVGVSDLEASRALWQKLLDPTPSSSFVAERGGPAHA